MVAAGTLVVAAEDAVAAAGIFGFVGVLGTVTAAGFGPGAVGGFGAGFNRMFSGSGGKFIVAS